MSTFKITGTITDADGSKVDFTAIETPDYNKVVAMSGMGSVGALQTSSVVVAPPIAPTIINVRTVASSNTLFNVANNGSTTSNNLNVHGTSSSSFASATVSVSIGGVLQGTCLTDVGGNWTYPLGIQGDATYVLTANMTYNGVTGPNSSNFTFTISAGLTGLPVAIGSNMVNNSTFSWSGVSFSTNSTDQSVGHVNNSCCIIDDTHALSMTLLATDLYSGSSNRTEISQNTTHANGVTQNISYEVLFSGSSSVNDMFGSGKWCVVGQLHDSGGSSPPYEQNLGGDADGTGQQGDWFNVDYSTNGTTFANLFQAGSNITRGVWHTIDLILMPSATNGIISVKLDGVQIVNQNSGPFGGISPYYLKLGMYRGGAVDQTQIIRYRNFLYTLT